MLYLRSDALEGARYSTAEIESVRKDTVEVLRQALLSKGNPVPVLYDSVLDGIQTILNSLTADEGGFQAFVNNGYNVQLANAVRRLPGPPPRQVNERYVAALDSSIQAREEELVALRVSLQEVGDEVLRLSKNLKSLSSAVERQSSKIVSDSATIAQVVATADDRLAADWNNKVSAWELERKTKDQALDIELADNILLLAGAASVGQRLVEQAAGSLTATDWAGRAKRERLNAVWMRAASFAFFVAALVAGGYILASAIDAGFELTIGDGILRGALILAVAGVGTFLSSESRRHFKEADSAEEVTLAITAIEPFYASSDGEDRETARSAVGDTVFVRNVLSRFASRDASKHASTTNQELTEIVELLTKSVELGKKLG